MKAKPTPTGADQPLKCEVEGQRLVISIGLKTLAFCAEHQDGNPKLKVLDEMALGKDVCHDQSPSASRLA